MFISEEKEIGIEWQKLYTFVNMINKVMKNYIPLIYVLIHKKITF